MSPLIMSHINRTRPRQGLQLVIRRVAGSQISHIFRRASAGSEALSSLARRVSMQQHAELTCRGNSSHRDLSRRYPMHLLFSSIHCYLDPSSGAALCTRELLELLAARDGLPGAHGRDFWPRAGNIPRRRANPLGAFHPPVPGGAGNVQGGRGDRPERQRRSGDAHAARPQDLGCHGRMSSTAIWLPCRPSITRGTC